MFMSKPRIAFLGLGIMGGGMARQLLSKEFPLTVFNRSTSKCQAIAEAGARVAESPRAAAAHADIVISMVADDSASRSLWLGDRGALAGIPVGALCVECSTVSVAWVRELAEAAAAHRCDFLDAPVTGSKPHAAAGELNFMVGGASTTVDRARPVLEAMGKNIWIAGPTGSGALLKLINNFVCGVQAAALAEAMAMIEAGGVDPAAALAVIANGAPGGPLVKTLWTRMTTPDFTPNFMLRLMAKDLSYAQAEAANLGITLKTGPAALEQFRSAISSGFGEQDLSAVVQPLRSPAPPKPR